MARETLAILTLAAVMAACNRQAPDANYDALSAQLLRRDSAWDWVVKPLREASAAEGRRPGLLLRTALVRDTLPPGVPVRLQYFLLNGPTLTFLDNSDAVYFLIFTEAGDTVIPSFSEGSLTFTEGFEGQLVLPRGAILGQTVDLSCIEIALYARSQDCWYGYKLTEPGRYLIETLYRPSWVAGAQLRDTAYLVVRAPR
jgi:hypothetical protein